MTADDLLWPPAGGPADLVDVCAVLVDGAVETYAPHSDEDDAVRDALSAYVWTWRLT